MVQEIGIQTKKQERRKLIKEVEESGLTLNFMPSLMSPQCIIVSDVWYNFGHIKRSCSITWMIISRFYSRANVTQTCTQRDTEGERDRERERLTPKRGMHAMSLAEGRKEEKGGKKESIARDSGVHRRIVSCQNNILPSSPADRCGGLGTEGSLLLSLSLSRAFSTGA